MSLPNNAYLRMIAEDGIMVTGAEFGDVTFDVDISTLSTHAKQDTGNTSLDSIDTKLDTLDDVVSGLGDVLTAVTESDGEFQYTGAPSNSTVGTAEGTVFTLSAGEVGFIQNLSANVPLAVKKGGTAATSSAFSFVLASGSAQDDGDGGATSIKDWVGAVTVAGIGGAIRYIAWKQAP